jgi:alginate O-acetyltransferase complex protein AlgI
MTLGSLLHEYVYGPLCGGPEAAGARRALAFFVTFVVAGAWHGAAWSYCMMGVYNGILVVVWRALRPVPSAHPLIARAEGLLAVGLVSASLVFLRPAPVADGVALLGGLLHVERGLDGLPGPEGLGLLALAVALHASPVQWKARLIGWAGGAPALSLALITVVVVALATRFADRATDFTYFQF